MKANTINLKLMFDVEKVIMFPIEKVKCVECKGCVVVGCRPDTSHT